MAEKYPFNWKATLRGEARVDVCSALECVCVSLHYGGRMLMPGYARVPVCAAECMNYLPVISHKRRIIQTAQDKALLNPLADYNHSLEREERQRRGDGNKRVERERKRWNEIISPLRLSLCRLCLLMRLFCLALPASPHWIFLWFCDLILDKKLSVSKWTVASLAAKICFVIPVSLCCYLSLSVSIWQSLTD